MELLIVSDSHGNVENIQTALSLQVKRPDGIFFLGDGARDLEHPSLQFVPIWAVRGNCDWASSAFADKTERIFHLDEHTILMTHGHEWGVKWNLDKLTAHAAEVGADVVLFGHTHKPHLEIIPAGTQIGDIILSRPMHLFNPGSIGVYDDVGGYSFGTMTMKGTTLLFGHGRI